MDSAFFTLIFILSVAVSSASQILLKISANKEHGSAIKEYLNPWVITGYLLFFVSTLVTVYAYKSVPLSLGPVLESLGYVFVGILGFLVLKERISLRKFIGMALIVAGAIVFAL